MKKDKFGISMKGITLIALIVTIVVLLILAGVSISMLGGENGIIKQAIDARNKTKEESAIEKVQTEVMGSYGKNGTLDYGNLKTNLEGINGIFGVPDKITDESFPLTIKINDVNIEIDAKGNVEKGMPLVTTPPTELVTENTKFKDLSSNNKVAVIPKGFAVSKVTGEDTEQCIDKGLVITDGISEFVWVPVKTVIAKNENEATTNKAMAIEGPSGYKGVLYDFSGTTSTVKEGCTTTTSSYREPAYLADETAADASEYNKIGITEANLQKEYNEMIKSVINYGGFYVSRYEISWNEENENIESKSKAVPVLSRDSNSSRWYGLYNVSRNYAEKAKKSDYLGSSMIWGSQWDAMLNWILVGEDAEKLTSDTDRNTDYITGNSETDKMNNIYDLVGCHKEWTIEGFGDNKRIARSANYYRNVVSNAISRDPEYPYSIDLYPVIGVYVSTRCTLYLK